MSALREGLLLGVCNPLLDITAKVGQDFLDKYGLKANDAILADSTHEPIYKEVIEKYKCEYIAGGSVQNTLRTVQWVINRPNLTTFFGGIGNDKFGKIMADNSKEQGLNAVYRIDKETPTGTCACLISHNNTCRSLVAYLGASQKFDLKHVLDNYSYVEKAQIIYASGYSLTVSFESILNMAEHVHKTPGKLFSLNFSAAYISTAFSKPLLQILPYVDLLFGNETEAQAFADLSRWKTTDLKEITKRIANTESKRKEGRTVVITQGKDSVLVAFTNSTEVKEFTVPTVDEKLIIDTIGAGDAFVGGYFAQLVQNKPLDVCIECGIYAAQEVIQQIGAHFPKQMRFNK